MPKKGHTEEQIVAVLRQAEAGEKVSELCRKVGMGRNPRRIRVSGLSKAKISIFD